MPRRPVKRFCGAWGELGEKATASTEDLVAQVWPVVVDTFACEAKLKASTRRQRDGRPRPLAVFKPQAHAHLLHEESTGQSNLAG